MSILGKDGSEQRFKDLLSNLNAILDTSTKNASGLVSYYGYKSYAFGYLNQVVSASISYEDFIKTTNYGVLVPFFMAIGSPVVSDIVKIPKKNDVIPPELLETDVLLGKLKTRQTTMNQINSITCRTQCFGSCTNNCFRSCLGSCATDCSNTCGETCVSLCKASCTNSCNNTCNTKCINSCTGRCQTQCSGCSGCNSTCQGCSGCKGCSGTCNGRCTGGCTGGCTGACTGGCAGCSSCSGGCSSCSGCGGSCTGIYKR